MTGSSVVPAEVPFTLSVYGLILLAAFVAVLHKATRGVGIRRRAERRARKECAARARTRRDERWLGVWYEEHVAEVNRRDIQAAIDQGRRRSYRCWIDGVEVGTSEWQPSGPLVDIEVGIDGALTARTKDGAEIVQRIEAERNRYVGPMPSPDRPPSVDALNDDPHAESLLAVRHVRRPHPGEDYAGRWIAPDGGPA